MAASQAATEIAHTREVLAELGMPQDAPTELYVDNSGAEALARERKVTHNSRHISRRYFKVREYQADGLLTVKHVNTSENPSDVLTPSHSRLLPSAPTCPF